MGCYRKIIRSNSWFPAVWIARQRQKKTSKVKYVIPVLAIAAVLLAAVIATPLLSDSKRHSKEINAGRTTDVSNDGLDAAENSNISDRAEDYVDETADSIPETVQNETANRPTQNTTEAILMNGAGGDSSDVQAEADHTKSQTDAQENAGCTDLQVSESADMDAWQEMSNIAVTLQITEIVTAEPDAVQKYAAKLLQVSDASGELITGQDIVLPTMIPTDCYALRAPTILPNIRISWCLRPTFMLILGRVTRSFYH